MKVGILTFYYDNENFGGQLQARALVRAVESFENVDVEQIQFDRLNYLNSLSFWKRKKQNIKDAFSSNFKDGISSVAEYIKIISRRRNIIKLKDESGTSENLKIRMCAFADFYAQTPHSSKIFNNSNITRALTDYDCFVCGGDQIWNDYGNGFICNILDTLTLKFVPSNVTKFSYCPSMPIEKVRSFFIDHLVANVKELDAVSVREKSSVPYIQDRIDQKVEVVVDPVLLLTREQWDKELNKTQIESQYVLCYLLGEGKDNRIASSQFASNLNFDLLTFPHIFKVTEEDDDFGDIQDYTSGPAEFIDLINNAEVVITDSFHAAVFSMIYHKQFYVLDRVTQTSGGSMGSRLTDFLSEYKLLSQKISAEELSKLTKLSPIDYTEADKILTKRRAESYEYLKQNLKRK